MKYECLWPARLSVSYVQAHKNKDPSRGKPLFQKRLWYLDAVIEPPSHFTTLATSIKKSEPEIYP